MTKKFFASLCSLCRKWATEAGKSRHQKLPKTRQSVLQKPEKVKNSGLQTSRELLCVSDMVLEGLWRALYETFCTFENVTSKSTEISARKRVQKSKRKKALKKLKNSLKLKRKFLLIFTNLGRPWRNLLYWKDLLFGRMLESLKIRVQFNFSKNHLFYVFVQNKNLIFKTTRNEFSIGLKSRRLDLNRLSFVTEIL